MKLLATALLAATSGAFVTSEAPNLHSAAKQRMVTTYLKESEADCFEETGAVWVEECSSLYYTGCNVFKMDPLGECTIMANTDSEVFYNSDQFEAQYWTYAWVPKGMTYAEYLGFEDEFTPSIPDEEVSMDNENDFGEWDDFLMAKLRQEKGKDDIKEFVEGSADAIAKSAAEEMTRWLDAVGLDNLAKLDPAEIFSNLQKQATQAANTAAYNALENFANGNLDPNAHGSTEAAEFNCVRVSEIPKTYEPGMQMQLRSGICGYKYQLKNLNEEFGFSFKVQKSATQMVLTTGAIFAAALAMF